MAAGYVANWGNNANDGLSWETAKKSLVAAINSSFNPININGFYNEQLNFGNFGNLNGPCIIDGYVNKTLNLGLGIKYGLTLRNISTLSTGYSTRFISNRFNNILTFIGYAGTFHNAFSMGVNNVWDKIGTFSYFNGTSEEYNNTYNDINSITILSGSVNYPNTGVYNNIYSNILNFQFNMAKGILYSLFINSRFKFTNGGLGTDETIFAYPAGDTDTDKLQNIKNRMALVYGGSANDYLIGCRYYSGSYNDIFVDADNGDFHLVPNCLAAHMSYDGDYIGALAEANTSKFPANFQNIVNIDANGNIIDQTLDASCETEIEDFGHIREIIGIFVNKNLAKRNGQSLNTESDLGAEISAGGNVLTVSKTYMCFDNTVIIDNGVMTTLNPYETYIAVDEGGGAGLGFTGTGKMKEVLIENYTQKVQMKFHKTDATLASANIITCFETESAVMVNVDGKGDPLYGDADTLYNVGTAVPLSARYRQGFILVKANNLPARVVA